ncbi:hypothetical protein HJC23_006539 [Cyclotella cryptica]|uniref:Uncharacterized protein n=1 Tax=Cyclotella cryptica TaxID=29204 RepID=A0ABD3PL69_9STRA|eukprot:CCRYP_013614-RA/>CCRYP_013614-RA protein AED:0.12 eAED:0.12 QI:0/-1/0/1/-1/1/1/0/243
MSYRNLASRLTSSYSLSSRQRCMRAHRMPAILLLLLAFSANAFCVTSAFAFLTPQNLSRISSKNAGSLKSLTPAPHRAYDSTSTKLNNFAKDKFEDGNDDDDDNLDNYDYKTAAQIRKARKLLKDAKKKIKDKQKQQQQITETINGSNTTVASQIESPLPFFATRSATTLATQNSQKNKSKTSSGIIADGETMSLLSKSEPWELRPLSQMFQKEPRSDSHGNVVEEINGKKGGAVPWRRRIWP